jgi:hypothetical protein
MVKSFMRVLGLELIHDYGTIRKYFSRLQVGQDWWGVYGWT